MMNLRGFLFLVAGVLATLLAGCQTQPTRMYESSAKKTEAQKFSSDTVFLDARPPFDAATAPINGATNIQWSEFTEREMHRSGNLEGDLYPQARRLARLGISRETPVVILGKVHSGNGEDGRLAWTLKVMGVQNIRILAADQLSESLSQSEKKVEKTAELWKPQEVEPFIVTRREFVQRIVKPNPQVVILDVRTESEYLGKREVGLPKKVPDVGAMNIPWTEFFKPTGEVESGIREKLAQVGVTSDKEILIISNQGIRSGAVAFALMELGFKKVRNVSGGYLELLSTEAGKR
ncbi:MAG: sulfurtransferase [Pseudobdellovibrionaceae bacterium]